MSTDKIQVVISPAHYPLAQGASYLGFYEYPESVIWSRCVNRFLRNYGIRNTVLKADTLKNKVRKINRINPDLALEIHFNASIYESVNGCETLYYPKSKKGKKAATLIHNTYSPYIRKNRGIKEGWFRGDVPGRVDYIGDVEGDEVIDYFLRETTCPALILEPEFISQKREIQKNRVTLCSAIAEGINKYIKSL